MFALCMSREHPTIQDVYNQNCINKQIKGGYLLRYRRGLFCNGWSEEWVVLYEDSTIAWYADKGLSRPRGRIRICDSPDLLAVGEWTRKVPKRPRFPRNCHTGQLLAIGSRRPQDVHWLIAQSPAEVKDWMTAISNTSCKDQCGRFSLARSPQDGVAPHVLPSTPCLDLLPPPPQLPLEDKMPPHKQPPQPHQQQALQKPTIQHQKTPSTSLAVTSKSRENFSNDHTVISGTELGWGHGWGWAGPICAAEAACTCAHEVAMTSAMMYCQNVEDCGAGSYGDMDWSAFGDFCF